MYQYLLKKDRLIGHELIVQRESLFRRQLSLKDIYYNDLIKFLEESSAFVSRDTYDNIQTALEWKSNENIITHFSLKNGGRVLGATKLERRINSLQSDFISQYIKRAKNILNRMRKAA